jgi:hypothetical protein
VTFLKKLGTILLKVIGTVTGFAPLLNQYVDTSKVAPKIEDKLNQVLNIVITAEQMFAAAGVEQSGSQKLAAASKFVAQAIQQADVLVGRKPQNEALFTDASTRLTAALADILNSYGE